MDLLHRPYPPVVAHIRCHHFDREMEALLGRCRGKAMAIIRPRRQCQVTGTLLALRHLHLDMATVAVLHRHRALDRKTAVLLRHRQIE